MTYTLTKVGSIGNYYGGLSVKNEGGKFYWGIMNWDDDYQWQEIPDSLYRELISFESASREQEQNEKTGNSVGNEGLHND